MFSRIIDFYRVSSEKPLIGDHVNEVEKKYKLLNGPHSLPLPSVMACIMSVVSV